MSNNEQYIIGLDFGTLSVRGVLVNKISGIIKNTYEVNFKHGIMDKTLYESEKPLPTHYALQVASDYTQSMEKVILKLVSILENPQKDVIAIGVDFTACTILPLDKYGIPLSEQEEFKTNPHAYVKLWKHHGANEQATRITKLAESLDGERLAHYGGVISPEWMLPKVLEILEKAPEIYEKTDLILEAGDYISFFLTGILHRSACHAGYKGMWNQKKGFVSNLFLEQLNPNLSDIYSTKLRGEILEIGSPLGYLQSNLAKKWGLSSKVLITPSIIDAHSTIPAIGACEAGDMLMIIGTSSCDILIDKKFVGISGINGAVQDGVLPGFTAYESGQAAVGDIFTWFMENQVPYQYYKNAKEENTNIYDYMNRKVFEIPNFHKPLLALDWWNGSRSVLMDTALSGTIMGLNLTTTAEEIYRALIEATAFGKRKILETYKNAGIQVKRLWAAGGVAMKHSYLMQVYADVLQKEIIVKNVQHASAKGATIYARIAYEKNLHGIIDKEIPDLIKSMSEGEEKTYYPNDSKIKYYDDLYNLYQEAYSYFGTRSHILKSLFYDFHMNEQVCQKD